MAWGHVCVTFTKIARGGTEQVSRHSQGAKYLLRLLPGAGSDFKKNYLGGVGSGILVSWVSCTIPKNSTRVRYERSWAQGLQIAGRSR